ncbi:MAG: ferritin [Firmicutes bacterium]|nr:ferritin [Bacillota bacterium]
MLHEKVSKLLNEQINKEMFSAYLYLDIANYFANKGLTGFQNWYNVQAREEMDHALFFVAYLQNNEFEVVLEKIEKPTIDYMNFKEPLQEALKHERFVTDSINQIFKQATEVSDYRTQQFLQWFIKEQGEEEKNATELIMKYDWAKENLFLLDKELLTRAYTAPSLTLD